MYPLRVLLFFVVKMRSFKVPQPAPHTECKTLTGVGRKMPQKHFKCRTSINAERQRFTRQVSREVHWWSPSERSGPSKLFAMATSESKKSGPVGHWPFSCPSLRFPRKMGFGFVDIDLDHVSHN